MPTSSQRRRLLAVQSHLRHNPTAAVRSEVDGEVVEPPLLTPEEVRSFHELGYLVLPGLLSEEHCLAIAEDFDAYDAQRRDGDPRNNQPSRSSVLGALVSFAPVVERVRLLMAGNCEGNGLPTFSLHHQHASRLLPGGGGSNWREFASTAPLLLIATSIHLARRASWAGCGPFSQGGACDLCLQTRTTSRPHRWIAIS